MKWQKRLRLGIALFVVVFAAVVVLALLRGRKPAATTAQLPKKIDAGKEVLSQSPEGGIAQSYTMGKLGAKITFGNQVTYTDGSTKFAGGVTVELPDKSGRKIIVEAQEARGQAPAPGKQVGDTEFSGSVKLTTSDGIVVTTDNATY